MFFSLATIAALAAAAQATNIITFINTDSTDRTIYFTPNAGYSEMDPVDVSGLGTVNVTFESGYIGNAYAVTQGSTATAGMLAEVNFQGWLDLTYFDVSAIVDPTDVDNVRLMYPYNSPHTPTSGCDPFPCDNAYYNSDDVQTKTTDSTHLIVTLGTGSSNSTLDSRDVNSAVDNGENVMRKYVTAK